MLAANMYGIRFPNHDGGAIPAIEGLPGIERCLRYGHKQRSIQVSSKNAGPSTAKSTYRHTFQKA